MVASITAKPAIPTSIIAMPASGLSVLLFVSLKKACAVKGLLLYGDVFCVDRAFTRYGIKRHSSGIQVVDQVDNPSKAVMLETCRLGACPMYRDLAKVPECQI